MQLYLLESKMKNVASGSNNCIFLKLFNDIILRHRVLAMYTLEVFTFYILLPNHAKKAISCIHQHQTSKKLGFVCGGEREACSID